MSAMLEGVTVVDASGGVGSVCARVLGSFGARVRDGAPDARTLRRTLNDADVVILDARGGQALAMDDDALAAAFPRLVAVFVTPFGRNGPHSAFRGRELVVSAMGGTLRACGYPDRAPVKEAGDACGFHANAMAAAGAVFALHERAASGRGQCVDISMQEVAASRMTNGLLAWQFDKRLLGRAGPRINYGVVSVRCVWELADGFVFHSLMTGRFGAPANKALSDWMDERGADNPMRGVDWLAYDRAALPAETRDVWETAIAAFFKTLTKADIRGEGRRRGVNATAANEPSDVVEDAHLAAREFFTRQDRGGRTIRVPARFVREAPPATGAGRQVRPASGGEAPLAGVRVLDFSWALVGSFTTKALGDFGAEVVKVESSGRPCLSRIDVQVAASRRGDFDDKPWFAHMNTSKLGVRINLKHPDAREAIDGLVDWADIIVENFSPGTMHSLGLDYENLAARRPDLVMVSGSVYGQTGPLAREWGVDGTGAALSGRLALTGWPDRAPIPPSAVPYGDVVLPPLMAAAAIAALDARDRTGVGRHIDASMYEVCVQQMADAIVAAQTGPAPERTANRDPRMLHQGVYPTRGDDRWIAIECVDAEDWRRLCAVAERSWPNPKGFSERERDSVDAAIAAWTSVEDGRELMGRLQAAGVACGVVQDARDVIADPQLRGRGFLRMLDHIKLGSFEHQATPIVFSRSKRPMFPAPGLGEHTERVCRELLGMSPQRFAALAASNLFE